MLKIVKYPNKVLHKKAKKVSDFNAELKEIAENMYKSMQNDKGIGLAGPQVGVDKQILVVESNGEYTTYINPEITYFSKSTLSTEEGCLSLPGIFGYVTRAKKIHIKYKDVEGKTHKEKLKGLYSIVLQHEVDHLNGILFIDRAEEITQGKDILDKLNE